MPARRARSSIVPSVTLIAVLAALPATTACSKNDHTPPVATVSFSASRTNVPLGSPVDLTYRFDVAPNAPPIQGNYRVFVHVTNPDGQTLWADDHDPAVPTSQWKPGQTIQDTRTVFVPIVPYIGTVTVEVGLYKDDSRLSLAGPDPADRKTNARSYKVGTLTLEPRSESLAVVYKTGWHPMEYAPDNAATSWQWTEKTAVVTLTNPHADVMLYLQYAARPDVFNGQPQQVTVSAGDQAVTTFAADSNQIALQRIPITAAQLGSADTTDIRFDVDHTFVPAKLPGGGTDDRELGIQVYHVYVERR